jgi:hypothetical protein
MDLPLFFICFSVERTCKFDGSAREFRPEWILHGVTSQISYALWPLTGWFPNYSLIPPLCTVRCVVSWTYSSFRLVTSYSNSRSADASLNIARKLNRNTISTAGTHARELPTNITWSNSINKYFICTEFNFNKHKTYFSPSLLVYKRLNLTPPPYGDYSNLRIYSDPCTQN